MAKQIEPSLLRLCERITRKYSPNVIQEHLAVVYEEYTLVSKTEPEAEFWLKCAKSSNNLGGGMLKWIHSMIDELETGEEEETEGG